MLKISSPIPSGSGVSVVHRSLEKYLDSYVVNEYPPSKEYFPYSIRGYSDNLAQIVHTTPDHGLFHVRNGQHLVLTIHGYMLDKFMEPYSTLIQKIHYRTDLRWLTKRALKSATKVTAVSQFLADKVHEDLGFSGDIEVIPNGIDEGLFKPCIRQRKDGRIKVLFSGNLSNKKGGHWLLPILEKLDSHIDILYTSGMRVNNVLQDHPRLICLGNIPYKDMPQVYQEADILLFPTVREGFGLAAAEAMACGLPIVATNSSALPELVHHDKGGLLCGLGNIEEFSSSINKLANDYELRLAMGKYNRVLIEEKYTLKAMIDSYRKLFKELESTNNI